MSSSTSLWYAAFVCRDTRHTLFLAIIGKGRMVARYRGRPLFRNRAGDFGFKPWCMVCCNSCIAKQAVVPQRWLQHVDLYL